LPANADNPPRRRTAFREVPLSEAELALTGEQPTAVSKLAEGSNIRIPSGLMLATFALAMVLTIATGFSL
jgi:hypothetical protein